MILTRATNYFERRLYPTNPSLLDNDECANCAGILEELENIDDDCDRHGIVFVKTKDFSIAEEYGVLEYPALVYFESSVPNVFEGTLNSIPIRGMTILMRWYFTPFTLPRSIERRGGGAAMADHTENRRSNWIDHPGDVGDNGGRDNLLGRLLL